MPAPKYTESGRTIRCIRASVLLHPDLHRLAHAKADAAGQSLSDWIEALVARKLGWRPAKKETK